MTEGIRRGRFRARVTALALLMCLGVVGCSTTSTGTDPSATPNATASASSGPSIPDVDPDQQFTLDDTASFPDGLEVSTAGIEVRPATATEQGATATGGQVVVVSILVTNNTKTVYDPRSAVISAVYGSEATPATMITDSSAELQSGFDATIAPGDEGTAALGFAIPDAGLSRVTFIVDPNDDVNSPLSFSGKVEKSG